MGEQTPETTLGGPAGGNFPLAEKDQEGDDDDDDHDDDDDEDEDELDDQPWGVLSAPHGLTLRAVHLNTVRSRLVALRESLARQHSQVLADTPVFAPLDTPRLLALCRRATLIEVPPNVVLLEGGGRSRGGSTATSSWCPEWTITETTFGLVIAGELQMCLTLPEQHRHVDAASDATGRNGALPMLPLARLGPRTTFGEWALWRASRCPTASRCDQGGAAVLAARRDAPRGAAARGRLQGRHEPHVGRRGIMARAHATRAARGARLALLRLTNLSKPSLRPPCTPPPTVRRRRRTRRRRLRPPRPSTAPRGVVRHPR